MLIRPFWDLHEEEEQNGLFCIQCQKLEVWRPMLEGEDHGRQRLDVYPFYDPATIDIVRAVSGDLTCVRVAFCVAVVTQRFLRMFAIGMACPTH